MIHKNIFFLDIIITNFYIYYQWNYYINFLLLIIFVNQIQNLLHHLHNFIILILNFTKFEIFMLLMLSIIWNLLRNLKLFLIIIIQIIKFILNFLYPFIQWHYLNYHWQIPIHFKFIYKAIFICINHNKTDQFFKIIYYTNTYY